MHSLEYEKVDALSYQAYPAQYSFQHSQTKISSGLSWENGVGGYVGLRGLYLLLTGFRHLLVSCRFNSVVGIEAWRCGIENAEDGWRLHAGVLYGIIGL
jgi:hypothetical protein